MMIYVKSSCPPGWSQFYQRCFIYIPRAMTWAIAQRNCVSLQATLASVHSFQEYHHIQSGQIFEYGLTEKLC
uniref:C-type lectin domain-containing protein n=1 Tax=Poecilia mexicana TaxID=48701 RepID=A0A3B3WFG0_9TELE